MTNRIITASILFVMLSCTRDDVNLDQHATYEAIPESLVTYAEKELSDYMNTPNVNENNFRLTMQYWQEVTYVSESNYNFTNRNVSDNIWGLNYINVLNNLQKAKDLINV